VKDGLTDIRGIRVGHASDPAALTGCTVILCESGAVGGVEIRGWASGVAGLELLDSRHLVETLHGICLAGGSAFGLEAVFGVKQYLEERGVGFRVATMVVPLVAGAILFDLTVGNGKVRPDRAMGYQACLNGVQRSHLIGFVEDGALLRELFTRDGAGTLILKDGSEVIRQATIDDITLAVTDHYARLARFRPAATA